MSVVTHLISISYRGSAPNGFGSKHIRIVGCLIDENNALEGGSISNQNLFRGKDLSKEEL